MAATITPDIWARETVDLSHPPAGDTAVLVVHGIGVQSKHETLEAYGGAIERFWTSFAADGRGFGAVRKRLHTGAAHAAPRRPGAAGTTVDEVIELYGGQGSVSIGECHWDPVVQDAPGTLKLAYWVATIGPASLLFSCRLPSRKTGQTWGRWLARASLLLPLLTLLFTLLPIATLVLAIVRATRMIDEATVQKGARTIADAFHFTKSTDEANAMVETVVARARQMSVGKQRLVVVAHSQGGAVTWLALQSPNWPALPTQVVTLGSGHCRLLTLRYMRQRWYRRAALFAWNLAALYLVDVGASALIWGSVEAFGEEASWQGGLAVVLSAGLISSLLFGIVLVVLLGGPLLLVQRRISRLISESIAQRSSYWLDVWATHDVVPDGPVNAERHASLRVVNRRSILTDHVSYHENAAGVVAAIVHCIDPERLEHDFARVQEMRTERARRHWVWPRRRAHRRLLRSAEGIYAEFTGSALTASPLA